MSNFFDEALNNLQGLEERLLGPEYKYYDNINSPGDLKPAVTGDPSISALVDGVVGLLSYVELLIAGTGSASKNDGNPLGNKFFLETGAKCTDETTKERVTRYLYINNVADGNIPFISSGLGGINFRNLKGLIPGTLSNISRIDPLEIFQSFGTGSAPPCKEVELETINNANQKKFVKKHLTVLDIKNLSPCSFPSRRNPETGNKCVEAFTNQNTKENMNNFSEITEYLFYISLIILVLYFLTSKKK